MYGRGLSGCLYPSQFDTLKIVWTRVHELQPMVDAMHAKGIVIVIKLGLQQGGRETWVDRSILVQDGQRCTWANRLVNLES